jgi:Glycosyl hydrolase family 9
MLMVLPLQLTICGRCADRLKITLPTAFTVSRLAWSCLYFHDVWAGLQFQGKSMLYWCKREIKWGAYWLLKTYAPGGGKRTGTWGSKDKFVIMLGTVQVPWGGPNPGDFDCYKRAGAPPTLLQLCRVC